MSLAVTRRYGDAAPTGVWYVVTALALVSWSPCAASAQTIEAVRFLCTLPDGSRLSFARNLAEDFRLSIGSCEAVVIQVADAQTPAPDVPASMAVRTIVAPGGPAIPDEVAMPPEALSRLVDSLSRRQGLDPALASAVMYVESRYCANARSPKGAVGLMQIMPATGVRYGVDSIDKLADPRTNIEVGVLYLRDLLAMFPGRVDLAVAAYNAGEGAVRRHGNQIPPYTETKAYVEQVLRRLGSLRVRSSPPTS